MNNKNWQQQALALDATGTMSRRSVAEMVGVARSTVLDFLRGYEEFKSVAKITKNKPVTHLVIPDCQTKDGVSFEFLKWIGSYIIKKRPDVIINLGDFADMPSLSSWDKGKKSHEGQNVQRDIDATKRAMKILLHPLRDLQAQQESNGEEVYRPRMVMLYGNHCDRITRHVESNPELHGFLSLESLGYEEAGWETVPFLTPITIDGVAYSHYFANPLNGKAMGGTADVMLKNLGVSFVQGHRQVMSIGTRFLPTTGQQHWGLILGACYEHEEKYLGATGNKHFRGVAVLHNVEEGSYDPMLVSLKWLKDQYGI